MNCPNCLSLLLAFAVVACKTPEPTPEHAAGKNAPQVSHQDEIEAHAKEMLARGRDVFRDDTFASEEFWGGKLQLHKAIRAGFGHKHVPDDQVTSKLAALHFYQLAIPAPTPPDGSYDKAAAKRGQRLFEGKARCATCHVPPLYTEPGWQMHAAEEIGIDDFQARRSPDGRYRTTPLRGLFVRTKGGFYHDGRFADYQAVLRHYDATFKLGLSATEMGDLEEFLKSL